MPKCKFESATEHPFTDNNGVARIGFRLTYRDTSLSVLEANRQGAKELYTMPFFAKDATGDLRIKEAIEKGLMPEAICVQYDAKTLPFLRCYGTAYPNAGIQIGDIIKDRVTGEPIIYESIKIDCFGEEKWDEELKRMIEVPLNKNEAARQASQSRAYMMKNPSKTTGKVMLLPVEAANPVTPQPATADPAAEAGAGVVGVVIPPANGVTPPPTQM